MSQAFFEHHSHVPAALWRWPNFSPREIASKGTGAILINFDALDKLQAARGMAGKPFIIHSAYRDELYNAMVGGAPRSYHLEGRAFDIGLAGFAKEELARILKAAGFTGLRPRIAVLQEEPKISLRRVMLAVSLSTVRAIKGYVQPACWNRAGHTLLS